jgi:hypothetical protein
MSILERVRPRILRIGRMIIYSLTLSIRGAYNVEPRGNKKVVTLWPCWTPERPQQRSQTPTPAKNTPVMKSKSVEEIKQEFMPESPCTSKPASKRPRSIVAEMSIRKRTWQKEVEALGPVEGAGELESFEQILEGAAPAPTSQIELPVSQVEGHRSKHP